MAKRMSPFVVVLLSLLLISVAGAFLTFTIRREFFGAQGGEMVQLAAGHVPTMEDVQEQEEEARQVRRDLMDMTGSY